MVVVALAGGSTGLGRMILDAIVATKKHNVVLLSRGENARATAMGVDVRPVDYNSHASLVGALKGVHTVLSVIGSFEPRVMVDSQVALLDAAKEAGVTRFSPSEWAIPTYEGLDAYAAKKPVWEAAMKSGLEVARFHTGLFMGVFGAGTPKGEEEALGGLRPWNFVVNVKGGTADLPGDGNALTSFTDTRDIGRFVAAALDLPKWEHDMEMEGDRKSWREAVEILEKVQKRKFLIRENSIAELERLAENPPARFYNQVRIIIAKGQSVTKPMMNKMCLQVQPITLEEYIEKWWGRVELGEPKWEEANIFGEQQK